MSVCDVRCVAVATMGTQNVSVKRKIDFVGGIICCEKFRPAPFPGQSAMMVVVFFFFRAPSPAPRDQPLSVRQLKTMHAKRILRKIHFTKQ